MDFKKITFEQLMQISPDLPEMKFHDESKAGWDGIAKPIDSLGNFEEIICRIAAIQKTAKPDISKKALIIMCADNGVVSEGVTQTDSSVTASVASLMGKRMSSVGVMTRDLDIDIITADIGIDTDDVIPGVRNMKIARGTGNITNMPAMDDKQCLDAINCGIGLVKECAGEGTGIIATGEMGIGNTTTSTALLCALTGEDPVNVTGRGAGLSDEGLKRKTDAIKRALEFHGLKGTKEITREYAFVALRKVGGLDIAGLAGIYIGGALFGIPVVIDGFISAVSALCASYLVPGCERFMIASHTGREKGTDRVLDKLGLKPVITADMALGEGTGAVMMFPLLDMAMSLYKDGVRFNDTPIEAYERQEK